MSYKCGDPAPGLPAPARSRTMTITEEVKLPDSQELHDERRPLAERTSASPVSSPRDGQLALSPRRRRRSSDGCNSDVSSGFRPITDFALTKANLLSWQLPEEEAKEMNNDIIGLKGGSCRGLGVVCVPSHTRHLPLHPCPKPSRSHRSVTPFVLAGSQCNRSQITAKEKAYCTGRIRSALGAASGH